MFLWRQLFFTYDLSFGSLDLKAVLYSDPRPRGFHYTECKATINYALLKANIS